MERIIGYLRINPIDRITEGEVRMTNGTIRAYYIKRLEKHVGSAIKTLDQGGGGECPLGPDFPAIVTCLGGLELERLKNGNDEKKPINGFSIQSKYGRVAASGTVALVMVLTAAVVMLVLERMRVVNMPVVGSAPLRKSEIVVIERHIGDSHATASKNTVPRP